MKVIQPLFFTLCLFVFNMTVLGQSINDEHVLSIQETHTYNAENQQGEINIEIIGGYGNVSVKIINHYNKDYTYAIRKFKLKKLNPGLYVIVIRDQKNNLLVKNIEIGLNEE